MNIESRKISQERKQKTSKKLQNYFKQEKNNDSNQSKNYSLNNINSSQLPKESSFFSTELSREQGKRKISWSSSAMILTRQTSPSFSMPKAKRFNERKKLYPGFYMEMSPNLRSKLKSGIKFSKDSRHELFSIVPTPSPQDYKCRRFLQFNKTKLFSKGKTLTLNPEQNERASANKKKRSSTSESRRKNVCIFADESEKMNHISGGSIGKFDKHWAQFYPHTIKRLYNERILKEAEDEKKSRRELEMSKIKKVYKID